MGGRHLLPPHSSLLSYSFLCSPLMVKRMAAEWSMNPAKVITFQIGEIQVLQARTAKRAVSREVQFLALGIVDQHAPIPTGINLDDLVGGYHLTLSDDSGEGHE